MIARTITARYNGRCAECGALINRGDVVWHAGRARTYCLVCATPSDDASSDVIITRFASGATSYRNRRGRCEDAPCCGCCS